MFENLGQASKKFYYKCSENSRSQNVFRTDIFRKLTLDAPEKKAIEILAFASLVYLLDLLVCHTRQCWGYIANHRGHVAHVTFKSLIIGENKQHLKRDPQELLVDMNNLKHSLNIPPVLFRTE